MQKIIFLAPLLLILSGCQANQVQIPITDADQTSPEQTISQKNLEDDIKETLTVDFPIERFLPTEATLISHLEATLDQDNQPLELLFP